MANGESSAQDRVLLVEGPNDERVVSHLWMRHRGYHGINPDFCISIKNNVERLLQSIPGEILGEERTAVGILVDADDYPIRRWQAVADRLIKAKIIPPHNPTSSGTIIESNPRVGVWLMPDNQNPGEIEDFVEQMIPHNDPVWPLSKTYIDNIPQEYRMFTDGKILRAKVHAWLATRKEPRRMGSAIGAYDLNIDAPVASSFVNWLQQLFG